MESSRSAAAEAIQDTIARLERNINAVPLDEPITLHAVTPFPQVLQTTFGREVSIMFPNTLERGSDMVVL